MTSSQPPPIGILRYNAGNVGSVAKALARLAIPSRIVESKEEIGAVSGLIFPGAGAAPSAMKDLRERDLIGVLKSYEKPFLGLCLGMQLLFDFSEEGNTECLGIIKGKVCELPSTVIKPHMGWNMLQSPFASDEKQRTSGRYAYFVHGFTCQPEDQRVITMRTLYGTDLCAGVRYRNFFGVQWHPEKSGRAGDDLLLSFTELCT